MSFELKKEEASSLICIPHQTYGCLTSSLRRGSYFIQLFDIPLEGVSRFTFFASLIVYAASTSPAVITRWSSTGHQRGFVIARRHHTVEQYYGAPTLFDIARRHRTVERYGAPTRLRHRPPSSHGGAVLRGTNAASAEHQEEGLPSRHDCLSSRSPQIRVRGCSAGHCLYHTCCHGEHRSERCVAMVSAGEHRPGCVAGHCLYHTYCHGEHRCVSLLHSKVHSAGIRRSRGGPPHRACSR